MSEVISFTDYFPPARFDGNSWMRAVIDEAPAISGPWTTIDTVEFDTPDADPAHPVERSFTTANGTAPEQWYRVTFLDDVGGESVPTTPEQMTADETAPYATIDDLFRVLKIRDGGSDDQIEAARGDLVTATLEINAEIGWTADSDPLSADALDLVRGVCIDRAADLWRHRESIPGVLGGLDDVVQATPGRYSWERYAQRLAPLKSSWGIA